MTRPAHSNSGDETGRASRRSFGGTVLHDDRGAFAALELVIITPFIIVMLLLVVGFGRVARGRQLLDQAAQAAARAGSLASTPGQAQLAARQAVSDTLSGGGLSCQHAQLAVDTTQFRPGGQVSAALTCTTDLSSLAVAGLPGRVTLHSTAVSPLESYRPVRVAR